MDVRHEITATDGGVRASATTGANARPSGQRHPPTSRCGHGTINAICWSPGRLRAKRRWWNGGDRRRGHNAGTAGLRSRGHRNGHRRHGGPLPG
ncbi:hypothetical protein [Saccharopolyspora aridisoli]|uniref:hypothetical protein n=1 Tax=Saccharopolyspora aridisoli TaxID=2530385 RepID=UPI0038B5D73F